MAGFNVETILDHCPPGAGDQEVLQRAFELNRTLLTYNRDGREFGALNADHPGLAIVNCRVTDFQTLGDLIFQSLVAVPIDRGDVYIIEPGRIRIHRVDGSSATFAVSNM